MKTRIPLLLLFGAVAFSPALAANPQTGDAQAQAASLLKAEAPGTARLHRDAGRVRRTEHDKVLSAQAQAASLLAPETAFASGSLLADKSENVKQVDPTVAHRDAGTGDAQAQAQRLLQGSSVPSGVEVKKLAASR